MTFFSLLAVASMFSVQDPERDLFISRVEQVRFYAEIDEDSVNRLDRILGRGEILDLQSPGGDLVQTVRMAELVRERRGRVEAQGHCSSGCAIVWATARERLTDGFDAVTFHGTPITSLDWMRAHPDWVRPEELQAATENSALMVRLLKEAGVQQWLFHCAVRLQNLSHRLVGSLEMPASERVETTGTYSVVWFPRSVLEAAGVHHLDRYDPPNERQRRLVEESYGLFYGRLRIYWAQDGDCDIERNAIPGAPSGELGGL